MNTALPLIAIVLAIVGFVLGRKDATVSPPRLLGLVGLAILVAVGVQYGTVDVHLKWPLGFGLLVGALLVMVADWLGNTVVAIGLGTAAASAMALFGKGTVTAELGLVVGGFLSTLFVTRQSAGSFAGIIGGAVAAVNALGSYNSSVPAAAQLGSMFGLLATAAGILIFALPKRAWAAWLAGVVIAAGAYLITHRIVPLVGIGVPAFLGVLTGLAAMLLLPEDEADPFRMTIATVLWLGLATLAYGPARGFGMSCALLCGLAVPVALGRNRAVLSSGPLAALVFVRIFSQVCGIEAPALDIGQHYVLIGFAIGAILPACYQEWRAKEYRIPALGGLLWGVLFLALPVILTELVESKGLIGFVIGLGFGGFLLARRRLENSQSLAVAMGMSAASVLLYARLSEVDSITRHDKLRYVAYFAIGIAAIAAPLYLLLKQPKEEVTA